ncbi:MAG: hydrogenase [Eubacteriaceae bacterium]|nr:hydrogenase [Eubacteriaceae bacterium]
MENYLNLLSHLMLLSSFVLMANKRIRSYIKTFRMQSALIGTTAALIGFESFSSSGRMDVLVVSTVIIALKVIYIPNLLGSTLENIDLKVEKDFFLNIPILVLISCGIVVFSYFSISAVEGINTGIMNVQIVNSISMILMGILFMISRKNAIGQIVGFLVIENGLFVTAMFSTEGMPFIIDMGIFIDIITAVLIMGVMVFKINEKFESADTNKLKNLRG